MFARFQSAEEHEALVEGLLRARRLRQQIEIFQQYRSLGIKTLDQARHYELERRRREGDAKAKKQRDSSAYLFEKGGFGGGVEFGNSMSATGAGGGRRRGGAKGSAVEEDEASLQDGDEHRTAGIIDEAFSNSSGAGKIRDELPHKLCFLCKYFCPFYPFLAVTVL